MAKGLAVISGSNTVVFKALENGVVKMGGVDGSTLKPALVTISGSLTLSGSGGIHMDIGGSDYKLENLSGVADKIVISGSTSEDGALRGGLAWQGTSSMPDGANGDPDSASYLSDLDNEHLLESPDDFVVVNSDGQLRRANKIDASVVMLNSGQTLEQQVGAAKLRLVGTSHLGGGSESEVSLTKGDLEFKDVANRTKVTVAQDDPATNYSSSVTVDLDPNLQVETVSASAGLEVTGSSKLLGDLHVAKDVAAGFTGNAIIDGKMTVKGDLDVVGSINQITINQSNLSIEDAIILVGSGSDGTQGELGLVFGTEGATNKAFTLKNGEFYLGATTDNAADDDLAPDNDGSGKLILQDLSASAFVDALDLRVHNSATITGKLAVSGNVDLGDHASDIVNIIGTLTASAEALFQEHVTISGADKTDLTISDGDLTVGGSGSFTGDLNVDGTGSFGQSVTLRSGADLTLDEGNATLTDGDLTISGSALISASAGNALHIANGDIHSVKGNVHIQDGDLDVSGSTTLSSSAGTNALHVQSGDVKLDEALTVGGAVKLNDAAGALNIAGSWTSEAAVQLSGSLQVKGNVSLGDSTNDKVIVNGQFRAPIFDATNDAAVLLEFAQKADEYVGYMFYLKGEGNTNFPNGNKWYFNEGGVWHGSFFWDDSNDILGDDGL